MKRPYESTDLRKANDHRAQRERRRAHYRARTKRVRDKRRLLELIAAGIGKGWVQRW